MRRSPCLKDHFYLVNFAFAFHRGRRLTSLSRQGGGGRERQNWQQVARENAKFESYYNEQGFIPEEEREAFWEAIRRDLPNSFRFTGSRGYVIFLALDDERSCDWIQCN